MQIKSLLSFDNRRTEHLKTKTINEKLQVNFEKAHSPQNALVTHLLTWYKFMFLDSDLQI
jgi:hypothetical protein